MNSPQANLNLLVARVQKTEASNRRWRLLNVLLLLSVVSVVLMGAKPADRLSLTSFALALSKRRNLS